MTHARRMLATALLLVAADASAIAEAGPHDRDPLIVADGPDASAEREALLAAVALLPRSPARIAVIDANEARPEVRPKLLSLDTFITHGSPVVYVLRQSPLLRGARAASPFHTLALAAALWHELAHVDGADEREARKREEALWTSFVRDQRIDQTTGLRYLSALSKRPHDQLMAAR